MRCPRGVRDSLNSGNVVIAAAVGVQPIAFVQIEYLLLFFIHIKVVLIANCDGFGAFRLRTGP